MYSYSKNAEAVSKPENELPDSNLPVMGDAETDVIVPPNSGAVVLPGLFIAAMIVVVAVEYIRRHIS